MTTLPRPLVNQILRQAQDSPDAEICGLIGARNGEAQHAYAVNNVAEQPEKLFQMDPAGQIAALRLMRERSETLFAIYHSHPTSPAEPSATDLAEAGYPDALYLIVSLNTRGVLDLRGFRLHDGKAVPEPLEI